MLLFHYLGTSNSGVYGALCIIVIAFQRLFNMFLPYAKVCFTKAVEGYQYQMLQGMMLRPLPFLYLTSCTTCRLWTDDGDVCFHGCERCVGSITIYLILYTFRLGCFYLQTDQLPDLILPVQCSLCHFNFTSCPTRSLFIVYPTALCHRKSQACHERLCAFRKSAATSTAMGV